MPRRFIPGSSKSSSSLLASSPSPGIASLTKHHSIKAPSGKRTQVLVKLHRSSGSGSDSDTRANRRSKRSYSSSAGRPTTLTMTSSPSSTSSSPTSNFEELAQLLELAAERRTALIEFIDAAVDDAYNLCHGFGRVRWHPSKTREGVSICRARAEDDARLDAAVRGSCNVNASFSEMMDLLITETTEQFVSHEKAVNPAEFLDGQVLFALVPRTPEDRFVCVKWHCVRSLAPSVAKHRDYVYVEVVDQFEDSDGKKIGYRLSKSIDLDEMPASDTAHLFVRGKTLTLQTFTEASPGNLELYTMIINDLGERLPTWLVHKIVDTAAMRSACIRDHINQRRIENLVFADPKDIIPLSKRVCCVVCTKSFSLMRKKYNCVACGDVICNQCSVTQLVASQGISEIVGKRKARICVKCSSGLKKQELPRRASMNKTEISTREKEKHTRLYRSASSLDTSSSSRSTIRSSEDSSTSSDSTRSRKTIPTMFQFRPTSASLGAKADRSSKTDSSSPEDGTLDDPNLLDDEFFVTNVVKDEVFIPDSEKMKDVKYKEAFAQVMSDLDVGNFLRDGSSSDQEGQPKEPAVADESHVEVASFLTSDDMRQTDVEVASFISSDDDHEFELGATGSFRSSEEVRQQESEMAVADFLSAEDPSILKVKRASDAETPVPQPITMIEELIVEEMTPGTLPGDTEQPRRSASNDEPEMTIIQPVVVRKFAKRMVGRRKRTKTQAGEAIPPTVEEVVTESILAESGVDPETPDEETTIQLEDLQVHLDRMTQISENLKNLNKGMENVTKPSPAMATLTSYETKAKADAAAAIAASFIGMLERSGFYPERQSLSSMSSPVIPVTAVSPPMSLYNVSLAMGDGSIASYLEDSLFEDVTEPIEGAIEGWQTVYSQTIGKTYYYHESCGFTSWTPPTPEVYMSVVYMVL